jgi:hypothetical protein
MKSQTDYGTDHNSTVIFDNNARLITKPIVLDMQNFK